MKILITLSAKIKYAKGKRVIVNYGTTRKPEYYIGSITEIQNSEITVLFDDGEVGIYEDDRSKVGLMGLAIEGKKTKQAIPIAKIDEWLKVDLGEAKPKRKEKPNVVQKKRSPLRVKTQFKASGKKVWFSTLGTMGSEPEALLKDLQITQLYHKPTSYADIPELGSDSIQITLGSDYNIFSAIKVQDTQRSGYAIQPLNLWGTDYSLFIRPKAFEKLNKRPLDKINATTQRAAEAMVKWVKRGRSDNLNLNMLIKHLKGELPAKGPKHIYRGMVLNKYDIQNLKEGSSFDLDKNMVWGSWTTDPDIAANRDLKNGMGIVVKKVLRPAQAIVNVNEAIKSFGLNVNEIYDFFDKENSDEILIAPDKYYKTVRKADVERYVQ